MSPSHSSTLSLSHSTSSSADDSAQQLIAAKDMYRSKSLPLNATLPQLPQKDSPFVVPKYQVKTNRIRSRSNSMIAKQQLLNNAPTTMQSAASEPVLSSSLAQLLTTNSKFFFQVDEILFT